MNQWSGSLFSKFVKSLLFSNISHIILLTLLCRHFVCLPIYSVSIYETTLCSEKNTHSHFLSYLHELFVDLNKNCSEYTQGLIDSDNVKIRYSLRSMA